MEVLLSFYVHCRSVGKLASATQAWVRQFSSILKCPLEQSRITFLRVLFHGQNGTQLVDVPPGTKGHDTTLEERHLIVRGQSFVNAQVHVEHFRSHLQHMRAAELNSGGRSALECQRSMYAARRQ